MSGKPQADNDLWVPHVQRPRGVLLASIIVQAGVIGLAIAGYRVAPRAAWPMWLEVLACYGAAGAVVSIVWGRLIEPFLVKWTRDPQHWLACLDLGFGFASLVAFPIIVFMILGKLSGVI